MPKQDDDLTREGDEVQETKKAKLKIPVPTRDKVLGFLDGVSKREGRENQKRA
jgi:hypothetical protein